MSPDVRINTVRGVFCGSRSAETKDDAMDKLARAVMPILSATDMTYLLKIADNDLFEQRKFLLIERLQASPEPMDESVRFTSESLI